MFKEFYEAIVGNDFVIIIFVLNVVCVMRRIVFCNGAGEIAMSREMFGNLCMNVAITFLFVDWV